ncbi:MAG: hypothetical protein WDA20_05295 [Desulfuromonadales bacterium]
MRKITTTLPLISLIAVTRGMLGAGVGLLLADHLSPRQRQTAGWALFLAGAASTIPLAAKVIGTLREEEADAEEDNNPAWIGGYFHGCPISHGLGENPDEIK